MRQFDIRTSPGGDEDGDGVTNWQEMVNNTCPWPLPVPPDLTPAQRAARREKAARQKLEREAVSAGLERVRKRTRGVKLTMLPGSRDREQTQRPRIKAILREEQASLTKIQRAAAMARRPVSWADGRGGGGAIIGVDSRGGFRTADTLSSAQAQLTGTDLLWPVGVNPGPLGLALTGGPGEPLASVYTNQIAMWELSGVPLSVHQDFLQGGSSRIFTLGITIINGHATRVASVLAGTGAFSAGGQNTKGMAWRDAAVAFGNTQLVFNSILALPETGSGQVRVHNHSYGETAGWSFVQDADLGLRLAWYGDIYLSSDESLYFGRYSEGSAGIDEVIRLRPWSLPVWAAGNDREDNRATPPLNAYPSVTMAQRDEHDPNILHPLGSDFFFAECPDAGGWCPARGLTNGTDYWEVSEDWDFQGGGVILPATLTAHPVNLPPPDGGVTGYDTIRPGFSSGKNVLTAGAVNPDGTLAPMSSCGPCDGGRLKPDLVAPGVAVLTATAASVSSADADPIQASGTSFAAPAITGSLALLAEHYEALSHDQETGSLPTGPDGTRWDILRASTTKALAIHTATDLGNAGPDYQYGWGLLNAAAAADLITADFQGQSRTFIKEIVLPGDPDNDNFEVPEISFTVLAAGNAPIKVTACWTDPAGQIQEGIVDPPDATADPFGDSPDTGHPNVLINNLDLRIQEISHPQTTPVAGGPPEQVVAEYLPWTLDGNTPSALAVRGQNDVDNVEQVLMPGNATGGTLYRVTVKPRESRVFGAPASEPLYGDAVGGTYPSGAEVEQPVSLILSGVISRDMPLSVLSSALDFSANGLITTLTWSAVAGENYVIEASPDLQTWTAVSGVWNARLDWCTAETDLIPQPLPDRLFFRVRAVHNFPAVP